MEEKRESKMLFSVASAQQRPSEASHTSMIKHSPTEKEINPVS